MKGALLRISASPEHTPAWLTDTLYFDVADPPEHYAARYLGKPLDRLQWAEARKEIKALGFTWDDRLKAFARKAPQ